MATEFLILVKLNLRHMINVKRCKLNWSAGDVVRSADGRFEVSFKSNVLIDHNGGVMWIPCSIYKSSCTIDVNYFPFDEQRCNMSYGSWTYNADEVRLSPYTLNFKKVHHLSCNTFSVFHGAYNKLSWAYVKLFLPKISRHEIVSNLLTTF